MSISDAAPRYSVVHSAKSRNLGFDLLRIWMCFEVILCHFWDYSGGQNDFGGIIFGVLSRCKPMAVPAFMMLSFMVNGNYLLNWESNPHKLINRLLRIIQPIIFWAIVYFVAYKFTDLSSHIGYDLSWESLIWQILTGHAYNTPLWFMNDLLFFTVFIAAISMLPNQKAKTASFAVLLIASFAIQRSGLHGRWFGEMSWEMKYPMGRLIEMMPYISFAMLLFSTRLKERLEKYWKQTLTVSCLIFALLIVLQTSLPDLHTYSFDYSGWKLFVEAITLTFIFMLLPLDFVQGKMRCIIEHIAKYTLGIYCIHGLTGTIMKSYGIVFAEPENSFVGCIIIFVVGYAVCRLIAALPWSWCRQAVQ